MPSDSVFADGATPDVRVSDDTAQSLFERYVTKGPHAEYRAFEARISGSGAGSKRRSSAASVWEFIADAVNGSGGFANGTYLFPFKMEVENNLLSEKLAERRMQADYDRFPEHVCNAAWDLIVSASDMVDRKATGQAEQLLSEFWQSVDSRGVAMIDFLEYPHRQARQYGTGWIFMDRPAVTLKTKADDLAPKNRPYIYAVPTQNVVDWDFDEDGELAGVVILEPEEDHDGKVCPIRVWTRDSWALWVPVNEKKKAGAKGKPDDYVLTGSGPNAMGVVPCVRYCNDQADPGKALAKSEMLDVARAAQTVYNIDSESREIERKCALFLAIPVKSTSEYEGGKLVTGLDSALLYDGEAGEPRWISPDLTILERLDSRREKKKADCYQMAGLGALAGAVGVIQTKSGFHAEVEFSKTERRIARHAATAENVEKQLATLYLRFFGFRPEALKDAFTVTYPRDFGIRDMQKLIDDAEAILGLNVGDEWSRAELSKLAKARFPRKAEADITKMVDGAIAARSAAQKQESAIGRVKSLMGTVPKPVLPIDSQRQSDISSSQGASQGTVS